MDQQAQDTSTTAGSQSSSEGTLRFSPSLCHGPALLLPLLVPFETLLSWCLPSGGSNALLAISTTSLVTQKAIAGLLRQERHAMPLAEVCQGAGCWRSSISISSGSGNFTLVWTGDWVGG